MTNIDLCNFRNCEVEILIILLHNNGRHAREIFKEITPFDFDEGPSRELFRHAKNEYVSKRTLSLNMRTETEHQSEMLDSVRARAEDMKRVCGNGCLDVSAEHLNKMFEHFRRLRLVPPKEKIQEMSEEEQLCLIENITGTAK
ncbi:MAG: hypothetical protein AAGA30_04170 [Planctomycetota bacterium]